jgi:hypothetical protein
MSAPPRVIKANVASQYRYEDTAQLDLPPIPVHFRPYVKKEEKNDRVPSSFCDSCDCNRAPLQLRPRSSTKQRSDSMLAIPLRYLCFAPMRTLLANAQSS